MRITKKINNNVALGVDEKGAEVVVFGRGVGFPHTPYELTDTSVIQRVFRDIDPRAADALAHIADEALLAASDIAELARMQLDCRLNPNLAFTLADHLQFALDQLRDGGALLPNPLEAEVRFVYPREYELGVTALGMVASRCGARLPDSEAVAAALHLVAAEAVGPEAAGGVHLVVESTKVIERATHIVEETFSRPIDRSSFAYVRFAAHFRYLVARLEKGGGPVTGNSSLFRQAALDFPDVYACAKRIGDYLAGEFGQACTNEELLYLMMHINRLVTAT